VLDKSNSYVLLTFKAGIKLGKAPRGKVTCFPGGKTAGDRHILPPGHVPADCGGGALADDLGGYCRLSQCLD
jgi:hypothetical protein